jgi:hypothetical protein
MLHVDTKMIIRLTEIETDLESRRARGQPKAGSAKSKEST